MLLASLVVGVVVAYAFGPRPGLWAAGIALAAFVAAKIVPPLALYIYIVVGIGIAAAAVQAGRKAPHPATKTAIDMGRSLWKTWRARGRS